MTLVGEELVVWNEYPMEEIRVIEENEDINSIENEFKPFVGQYFLSEEEAFTNTYKKLHCYHYLIIKFR